MRRRFIVSGVLALLIAISVSLLLGLTPSEFVKCYDLDADNNLYTVSEYGFGYYLQIRDGETGKSSFVSLRSRYSSDAYYYDIKAHGGKLYLLVQNGYTVCVDTYSLEGKYLGRVYEYDGGQARYYINANLSLSSQHLYDAGYEDFRLDCFVYTDGELIAKRIDGKNIGDSTIHYVTRETGEIMWAGFVNGQLVYQNDDSEFFRINNDRVSVKLDVPEEFLIYKPFVYSAIIGGVDLTGVRFRAFGTEYDEKADEMSFYINDDLGLLSSYPVAEGVTFGDLRNVKVINWVDGNYCFDLIGMVKDYKKPAHVYRMNAFGSSPGIVEMVEPTLGVRMIVISFLLVGISGFVVLLIVINIISYLLSLRKVVIKQILLSIAITITASAFMYFKLSDVIISAYDCAIVSTMTDMLNYVCSTIDGDYFAAEGLTEEQRSGMKEFENNYISNVKIRTNLFEAYTDSSLSCTVQYFEVSRYVDGEYIYEYYSQMKKGALARYFLEDKTISDMKELTDGTAMVVDYKTDGRTWLNAYAPVIDSSGNNVGCITIGSNYSPIEKNVKTIVIKIVLIIALILVLTSAAFLVVLQRLLSPLKKIKKAVSEIANGKIGTTVSIRSNDELQDIAHSFTDMSQKLEQYFNNINLISKAYERYLPRDFFNLMDKRNVMEVKPEDRKEIPLTYLFVGMDTSSIHRNGSDGFAVINKIYGIVSSAVAANNGVVQALDDRCITCIFSRSAAAAVEAALTVQEKLTTEEFKEADIRITIQRAESTVGVIGTGNAMKTITVSSAISLQRYINYFMRSYSLTAIATDNAKNAFGTLNVTTRFLGRMKDFGEELGKDFDVELYEIIDGCMPEDKQKKLATLASFNRGMDAIAAGDYKEGRKNMIDVLRINRDDMIARHYLNVCEEHTRLLMEKKNDKAFD